MPQDYYEPRERRSEPHPSHGERETPRREHSAGSGGRPRKKKRRSAGRTAALVLLYVAAVIGMSILLACIGWTAAGDVLALNKPEKTITFTITEHEDFDSVADRLKDEGMIEYKFLFKLFASITHKKDEIIAGSYTLNTDMDYRALLAGMSANSSNRSEVTVTIPEGYNTDQIFALLEEKGVCTVEKLREAAAKEAARKGEQEQASSETPEAPKAPESGALEGPETGTPEEAFPELGPEAAASFRSAQDEAMLLYMDDDEESDD